MFDYVVTMEDLSNGQRIGNYSIDYREHGSDAWQVLIPPVKPPAPTPAPTLASAPLGDRPDGHDPRDQYVGHKRIDFPIVDPASTPMRKLRFVCLRALGDDPTAFVRSFAVHQKRVPWEAPRSKR